jgi:hypothetical protein
VLLLALLHVPPAHAQSWWLIRPPPDYFEPDVDTSSTTPLPRVPPSPYGTPAAICPQADGLPYQVAGQPGTPYTITPFTEQFREPPVLEASGTVCRTGDSHCMKVYEMEARAFQARPFDNTIPGCRNLPDTWFMGYNGMSPGPTIRNSV